MKTINYLLALTVCLLFSCNNNSLDAENNSDNLNNLPEDTGGIQESHILGSTDAVYGYHIYTPSEYNSNSPDYPLLVFLHGSGQRGNSETNPDALNVLLYTGPPRMIEQNKWDPTYPMIVASPQLTSGNWNANDVHNFINYLIENYNINTNRIYMTGYSLGGFGCFNYISNYGDDSYAASIVPIAGGGNANSGDKFTKTPVWAFHGDVDTTVSKNQSIDLVNAINAANPETRAKITIYPDVAHNSDTRTFDGTGMGTESNNYDPFDITIYDWMFSFEKSE